MDRSFSHESVKDYYEYLVQVNLLFNYNKNIPIERKQTLFVLLQCNTCKLLIISLEYSITEKLPETPACICLTIRFHLCNVQRSCVDGGMTSAHGTTAGSNRKVFLHSLRITCTNVIDPSGTWDTTIDLRLQQYYKLQPSKARLQGNMSNVSLYGPGN